MPSVIRGGEDVVAGLVLHADVHVHAAARHVFVGLGHEGRLEPVAQRDALDDAFEADRLVAGEARIVHMAQVDLPLARAVFGERRAGRDILHGAGRRDLRQDVGDGVEVRHRIDLRAVFAPPGQPRRRRLRVARGRALGIHEIELEFDRDDRPPAASCVTLEHGIEHMARIAEKRLAIVVQHLHLELRDGRAHPGCGKQAARNRQAGPVGVALVEAEAGGLDRAAHDVEREHRARQVHALVVDRGEVGNVHALAAQDAAEVGQQQVHDLDRGARGEESLGIRKVIPEQGHVVTRRLRS